jgi:hypothetical protein
MRDVISGLIDNRDLALRDGTHERRRRGGYKTPQLLECTLTAFFRVFTPKLCILSPILRFTALPMMVPLVTLISGDNFVWHQPAIPRVRYSAILERGEGIQGQMEMEGTGTERLRDWQIGEGKEKEGYGEKEGRYKG